MKPRVQWLTPSPLWGELAASPDKGPFRSPALLQFSTDQFMETLQGMLAKTPEALRDCIAQPETWRRPAVGLGAALPAGSAEEPLAKNSGQTQPEPPPPFKFFQPVHSRFYMVSASLVCRLPGLPDHTVRSNEGERTTLVLRRVAPKAGMSDVDCSVFDAQRCDEYAWLGADPQPGWARVEAAGVVNGEEKLPMFAFQFGNNGSRRRMFAGLIPVSRRQTYVAGRETQAKTSADDARKIEFQRQVVDPWAELLSYTAQTPPLPSSVSAGIAQGSALILIDFANYLIRYMPQVWSAIEDPSQASVLGAKQRDFYSALGATAGHLNDSLRSTLADAIGMAKDHESEFESAVLVSGAAPSLPSGYPGVLLTDTTDSRLTALMARGSGPGNRRNLQALADAALEEIAAPSPSKIRRPAKDPVNPQGDDWYVVRCVYERPQCGNALPVVSEPSRPFQLASYFDPDAPARSIQVALPVDTTPAALRKYDKGVAFMISDQLGKQMSRVKGLKQLMEGDLADPNGLGLGMICSFSIPIITICAFIVLMIFLILLDIVFWWMPFFKICFPLPTLKAKGS